MSDEKPEVNEILPSLAIEFDPPLEAGGAKVDAMELHEPTAGQVKTAQKLLKSNVTAEMVMDYQQSLISQVSGIGLPFVIKMPIRKHNEAARYLQSFIDSGMLNN